MSGQTSINLSNVADITVKFWSTVGDDGHAVYRVTTRLEPDVSL